MRAHRVNRNFTCCCNHFIRKALYEQVQDLQLAARETNEGDAIEISWRTTAEQNTDHFDVEKSLDGILFSTIGTVFAAGNNSAEKDYLFRDPNLLSKSMFYRLKMVDKDGKFTYSNIVRAHAGAASSVKIYPNPAKAVVRVEGTSISIIDLRGSLVKEVVTGTKSYSFNISNWPAGVYYLKISEIKKVWVFRFVKK